MLSGVNMAFPNGAMAYGKSGSNEEPVFADEVIGFLKTVKDSPAADDYTPAEDVTHSVGFGGVERNMV